MREDIFRQLKGLRLRISQIIMASEAKASVTITRCELFLVDIHPPVVRTDAIQSFQKQETPILRIHTSDGQSGTGYTSAACVYGALHLM